ncbi:PREDICTED: uncharacterized protein LOC109330914 [Lupinus angustifolius]|uniref:uncharacterized protein LOC109330914 n=1 Tax=Lupinus angustifolius TaxID=3871 RepID=UPI00092E3E84|nr:PREDICTED: uncharacterized protein LOC109330914 [Lupinus angustifolius]
MTIPPGVTCTRPNKVCKLRKSLSGLKQAGRQWYTKLSECLISLGYTQSHHEQSLFTKSGGKAFTALLVYVDDLVLAGNHKAEINRVKQCLNDKFKIKDLGSLKYFLGLEISREKVKTTKLDQYDHSRYVDPTSYIRLVGRLLYLTNIRPDIGFDVQQLSQFMAQLTNMHQKALCRVLRYIKGSLGQGLSYPNSSILNLKAFSDSDWAVRIDSRKPITGCSIFLGESLVSWKSKKQNTVARSSSKVNQDKQVSHDCGINHVSMNIDQGIFAFDRGTLTHDRGSLDRDRGSLHRDRGSLDRDL